MDTVFTGADKKSDKDRIENLAISAKNGDRFAFVELTGIFSPYTGGLARSFHLPESEYDDLCQAGRIALYRAVCSYDGTRSSFITFAKVCIKNAMTSHYRTYCSENKISFDRVSLDEVENEKTMADPGLSPENVLLAQEFIKETEVVMCKVLSESERQVLLCKLSGIGIPEISVITGKDTKSVENTLFRARKKMREALNR